MGHSSRSPVSYAFSLIWLCVQVFQVRIYCCILWCNLQWRRTSTVTLACTSHVIGKRLCYWPQTFYLHSCFSLVSQWNVITTTEEGRKWKQYSERFQTMNKVLTISLLRSPLQSVLRLRFFFFFFFFLIYAKENASPVFACVSFFGRLLFTSWIDLSWNQDVHFTREALSYHRSVLVCQLRARKNY